MFGPEWFNDAWKIYAKYMQRPRVYPGQLKAKVLLWPGNGFDGFALWHGTHHPTSPCQELAMQPHVGLFKKGNTWNPAKLGKAVKTRIPRTSRCGAKFPESNKLHDVRDNH